MNSKSFLIIDDDEDCNVLVKVVLEQDTNWEILVATTGKEGIARARSQQPDGILLDIAMPEQDGLAVYRELQSNPLTRHIPVIFMTALSETKEIVDLRVAETVELLTKPLDVVVLADRITEIFNKYSALSIEH